MDVEVERLQASEVSRLAARIEHLENIIAVALSVLADPIRDRAPRPEELLSIRILLTDALEGAPAEPKEEHVDAAG
jgi:hypothetical protein